MELFMCGPHCGIKDGYTAHCKGCHSRSYRIQPHGNIDKPLDRRHYGQQ